MGQGADRISSRLLAYLRDQLDDPRLEIVSTPQAILGGNQSSVYRFELAGARDDLSKPLVLRLNPREDPAAIAWQGPLQNALAREGLPVPRVHFVGTDRSILGGPFLIMDLLHGEPLIRFPGILHQTLGRAHAELHGVDPGFLIRALNEQGVPDARYRITSQVEWLRDRSIRAPWIRDGLGWIVENRPPEPSALALCHRDFHALNVLVQDGTVSGILDWGGLLIADPAFDVANTIMLLTIPGRHLMGSDAKLRAEPYLASYRSHRPLDDANLGYYGVLRCLTALVRGFLGAPIYQHPRVVEDLAAYVREISGVEIPILTPSHPGRAQGV